MGARVLRGELAPTDRCAGRARVTIEGGFLRKVGLFGGRQASEGGQASALVRRHATRLHGFAIRPEKLPGFAKLAQAGRLAAQPGGGRGGGLRLDEQGVVRLAQTGRDRVDLFVRKHERTTLVMEVAKEGILTTALRVTAPGGFDLPIGRKHRIGGGSIGGIEPSTQ